MILAATVQRVSVENDNWIKVTDICVVVAAALALAAIVVAVVLARSASKQAASDRRLDFELGILASLSYQFNLTQTVSHVVGYVRAVIRTDDNDEDLLALRVATGVHPNAATNAASASLHKTHSDLNPIGRIALGDVLNEAYKTEIAAAIDRRVPKLS